MALERLNPDDRASWAQNYADHVARYAFAAEYVRGRRVLDVGTGPGYGAFMLKAAGASSVTAIDIDPGTVEAARKRYASAGIEYVVGNAETLDGLGPVDVVCSFENIEHLPQPPRFVTAAARVLAPDGILLCSTPDRRATPPFVNGKPSNPFHTHEWYADEFRAMLATGFAEIDMRAQVRGYGQALREEGAAAVRRALELHDAVVQRSFASRIRRLLGWGQWLAAAREAVTLTDRLGAASPADYPIVPGATAALHGHPFCHFAIGSHPRK